MCFAGIQNKLFPRCRPATKQNHLRCYCNQQNRQFYIQVELPVTVVSHFILLRHEYTGCPRRNVPDFGRVFLMLKYTDITQNTYIQSWTVTEIMAREKWSLLAVPNTAICTADTSRDRLTSLRVEFSVHCAYMTVCAVSHVTSALGILIYSAWNPKDNYDMSVIIFVVNLIALCHSQVSLMLSTDINIIETTYSCQF